MYRARNHLNERTMRYLYYSYIHPYLIYCIEIRGLSLSSNPFNSFIVNAEEDCKNYDFFLLLCTHCSNFQRSQKN